MYDVGENKYNQSSDVQLQNNLNGLSNIENVSKAGFDFAEKMHFGIANNIVN